MMYAEIIKLRRTPFFWCHLLFPIVGAVGFGYYFTSYVTQSETNRFRLILEIAATIFPILTSIMTGIVVAPEEATGFYTILSEEKRGRAILTKLLFLWGMGALALLLLAACFGVFSLLFIRAGGYGTFFFALSGMAVFAVILYVFHLFLNLKWGIGISVFFGVFESLQAIIYSNITLTGIFWYLPFAWQINWCKDVLQQSVTGHAAEWGVCALLTVAAVVVFVQWFLRWEGRKVYET